MFDRLERCNSRIGLNSNNIVLSTFLIPFNPFNIDIMGMTVSVNRTWCTQHLPA